MNLDIRTLIFITCLVLLVEAVTLYVQFRLDKTFRGVGWWTVGLLLLGLGYALTLLIGESSIAMFVSVVRTLVHLCALLCIYVGVLSFLDLPIPLRRMASAVLAFGLLNAFFSFVVDRGSIRQMIGATATALVLVVTARNFLKHRQALLPGVNTRFLGIIFLVTAGFFILRAMATLVGESADSPFIPTLTQIAIYPVSIAASILWTFGFIILVNQRLTKESREASRNTELIFDTSPDAVTISHLNDGKMVRVNGAFLAMTGYSRDEVIGATSIALHIWKEPAQRQAVVQQLQKTGLAENVEAIFQRKDGSELIGLISARLIDLEGAPHIISVTRNITPRKLAETALRNSEERLREVLENALDASYKRDLQSNEYAYLSPVFYRISGYTQDEVKILPLDDVLALIHPVDAIEIARTVAEATASAERSNRPWQVEYRFKHKDGQYRWLRDRFTVMRDEQGNPLSLIGSVSDITERKLAAEALRQSEEGYRSVVEWSPASIVIHRNNIITYVNASAIKLFGASSALELIGTPTLDRVHPEYQQLAVDRSDVIENDHVGVPSVEMKLLRMDGTVIDTEVQSITVVYNGAEATHTAIHDITDRKQAVVQQQKAALELERAYEETIAGWSHALEMRDHETNGHSKRVVNAFTYLISAYGVPAADQVNMRRGALLHDIGKMVIPDSILQKPGLLSDEEWVVMRMHVQYAYDILSQIDYLRPALDIPYCHHERWDGTGYPRGLKGEAIPIAARLFSVVDVWDGMLSRRPYHLSCSKAEALQYLRDHSGTQFDPRVVELFLSIEPNIPGIPST